MDLQCRDGFYLILRVDRHTLFLMISLKCDLEELPVLDELVNRLHMSEVNCYYLFPLLPFYFIMDEVTVQLIDGQFVGHSLHACITWVFLYSSFLIMMSVAAQLSVGQLGSHPPHTVFIVNFFS